MIDGAGDDDKVDGASDEIPFTVVSEPNDGEEDDTVDDAPSGDECEDLGSASVRLKDILRGGKDLVDEEVPVYGGGGGESAKPVVGHLRLSVECLSTLRKVKAEMDAATTMASSGVVDESVVNKSRSLVQ